MNNYYDTATIENTFPGEEYLKIASFTSFNDYFNIYLNAYTFKWYLHIESEYYYDFHVTFEDDFACYLPPLYSFNSFQELEERLNAIIEEDFDYEIRHNAKRWWSYLPAWMYLESIYIHNTFINYFQQALEKKLDSVEIELSLSVEEQKYLNDWYQIVSESIDK